MSDPITWIDSRMLGELVSELRDDEIVRVRLGDLRKADAERARLKVELLVIQGKAAKAAASWDHLKEDLKDGGALLQTNMLVTSVWHRDNMERAIVALQSPTSPKEKT